MERANGAAIRAYKKETIMKPHSAMNFALIGIAIAVSTFCIALAAGDQPEGTRLEGEKPTAEIHTRGINCTGDCTAVGNGALGAVMSPGAHNTAVGSAALSSTQSGDYNTSLGYSAGS